MTEDDRTGLWEVPTDGDPSQLLAIGGFPNDILFDADRDRMLVTESMAGVVHAVDTDGSQSVWFEDDRLDTEGFGVNGITRDEDGNIYLAANSQNLVLRVAPEGETTTVASGDDGLVFPSDVLFGPGELSDSLFICNFANSSPGDGAILRTQI